MKAKNPAAAFSQHLESLSEDARQETAEFFRDLDQHISLPAGERAALRRDFERAILYYAREGLPTEEALERLSPAHLGGFYARPPVAWFPLDNAAKIYPLSMKHGQMAVFRLSSVLKEEIEPCLLQIALNFTIKRFPSFATTVKKGFFWHYLDATKMRYTVEPESTIPCMPLKVAASGSQSFRVLYWKNRISCEYFHILTDGSGGMEFLKTLTAEYLRLKGADAGDMTGILRPDDAPDAEETENGFDRAAKPKKAGGFMDKSAVQLSGKRSRVKPCRIVQLKLNAAELLGAARDRGATVTAYVLSRMFAAFKSASDETQGEFSIQVPVNMRKYIPSRTLRNFSMYAGIRIPVGGFSSPDDILPEIMRQLQEKCAEEPMREMMLSSGRMVSAVRFVPLFIKAPIARLVYGFMSDRIFTSTLSNLGVVRLPEKLEAHLDSMEFLLGTAPGNGASCAMVTAGGTSVLSISKNTKDPSFEEALLRLLQADGLTVRAEGSELYEA